MKKHKRQLALVINSLEIACKFYCDADNCEDCPCLKSNGMCTLKQLITKLNREVDKKKCGEHT